MRGRRILAATLLAGAAMSAWGVAYAQVASPEQPTGGAPVSPPANGGASEPLANPSDSTVGEVIVTAQKRSERLQDVPAQVDVVTASNLAALHITTTPDIQSLVPNLTIAHTDTYKNSTIVLRSISQANNSDVPVAVIVDGVPEDDPKQFNTQLFDVSQIEVLKGPQGSLYGRNAEAGAIIITTAPPTNAFHAAGDISYGNANSVNVNTSLSGAIIPDKLLFRLSADDAYSDGLITNVFTGKGADYIDYDYDVRGSLLFRPLDRLQIDTVLQYGKAKAGSTYFSPVFSANPNDFQKPQENFPGVSNSSQLFFSTKLDYDLDFATASFIVGYARVAEHQVSDVDFTNPEQHPEVFQVGDNQPSSNRTDTEEVRLVSKTNTRFRWLVSADYLDSSQVLSTNIFVDTGHPASDPTNPALQLVSSNANNSRTDYGASAQVDYDILKNLTLTAGVRYDNDQRNQTNLNGGGFRQVSFNHSQPKATLTYKFSPTALTYATYGVGFRSGGFNQPNYPVPIFRDETLTNYEVGAKTQWFNRRLTVNAAAYSGTVRNYQFSFIDFRTATPATGTIDRVRVSGGEVETRLQIVDGLSAFANAGVSIPIIRQYRAFPGYVGNETPRANNNVIQGGFDFTHRLTDDINVFAHTNVRHISDVYWFIDNADIQQPKTYLDASVGFVRGPITFTVWGHNLTDTRSYDTYFPNQETGAGRDVGFLTRPASYGFEIAAKY